MNFQKQTTFILAQNFLKTGILFVCLFILADCKKTYYNDYLRDYSSIYAAAKQGRYIIYDVDSVIYHYAPPFQLIDTVSYQIKELQADTFLDNLGRVNWRLERYRRPNAQSAFIIDRVWYSYTSASVYERVEDDIRYVKMAFPPQLNVPFQGNRYVPFDVDSAAGKYDYLKNWTYHFTVIDTPINTPSYSTKFGAVVEEVNEENLIDKKYSRVVYAKDAGMIFKEWILINKQDASSSWASPNKANGFKITYRVAEFKP